MLEIASNEDDEIAKSSDEDELAISEDDNSAMKELDDSPFAEFTKTSEGFSSLQAMNKKDKITKKIWAFIISFCKPTR